MRTPMTISCLLLIAFLAAPADGLTVVDGNRIRTSLSAGDGIREMELPAVAGTRLRIKVRGDASLALLDEEGTPLAVSQGIRSGKAKLALDELPATGTYRLLLGGEGDVRLKVRARAPRKIRFSASVTSDGETTLPFAAVPGSVIDVKLRGQDGVRPDLTRADVPGDGEVPLRPTLRGSKVEVEGIQVPGLGEGQVVVTVRGEGGTVDGTIRVKAPTDRSEVVLPAGPAGDPLLDGGDHLILREDSAELDGKALALRVRGSRVHLLQGRGPDGSEQERVAIVIEIETGEGALAAWVLIRIRDPRDFRPGSIALRDEGIEMLHVVTSFRGLLFSTVVPPISGPRAGDLWIHRGAPEADAEVEGTLDGVVERVKDGRIIELRGLPIRALVEVHRVEGSL